MASLITLYTDAGIRKDYARIAWVRQEYPEEKNPVTKVIHLDHTKGYTISDLEYMAIIQALEENLDAKRILIQSDSEFAVKQINGEYGVNDAKFYKYLIRIEELRKHREVRIEWVRRNRNKAGLVLEEYLKRHG